eukprot:scaffold136588_cov208-Phaeocystis_antarctica.AAC.1
MSDGSRAQPKQARLTATFGGALPLFAAGSTVATVGVAAAALPRSPPSVHSAPREPPWCPLPGLTAAPAAWRAAAWGRGRDQRRAVHARPQGGRRACRVRTCEPGSALQQRSLGSGSRARLRAMFEGVSSGPNANDIVFYCLGHVRRVTHNASRSTASTTAAIASVTAASSRSEMTKGGIA